MPTNTETGTSGQEGPGDDGIYLSVHPSVVFKLGSDLITDDVQAITELIKNSYDANSSFCNVVIDTKTQVQLRPELAPGALGPATSEKPSDQQVQGFIRVQDGGSGMRRDDIIRGWLTVSASTKGALKEELKGTNDPRRTPLGDKGLGRLGAQRLGRSLVLTTVPRLEPGEKRQDALAHRVTIVWDDFDDVDSLLAVPIHLERIEAGDEEHGSTIEIRGLHNLDSWRSQNSDNPDLNLEREVGTMISPYEVENGFSVDFEIDNSPIDLRERARAVLDQSTLSYGLAYESGILSVDVGIATTYMRPATGAQDIADFDNLVTADNGYAFFAWLVENRQGAVKDLNLTQGDDRRFVRARTTIFLEDLDPEREIGRVLSGASDEPESLSENITPAGRAHAVDPGPFSGHVDQVILRRDPTDPEAQLFASRTDYSDFVKAMNGVRIYRDGFGIRVGPEWLDLASQWSSGRSWYTLRPENTLGHIDISARDNDLLQETTNREAFRETPAYRNFMRLLAAWLSYGARVQEAVRRGYNDYKSERIRDNADLPPSMAPEAVIERLQQQASRVESAAESVAQARLRVSGLTVSRDRLESQAQKVQENIFSRTEDTAPFAQAAEEVGAVQREASAVLAFVEEQAAEFRKQRALLDVVAEQVRAQEEQLNEGCETVGLGLVAETLSHEVLNLTQRLRARSAHILNYLSTFEPPDKRVWNFAEETRSVAASLSKQVSRLDPSLRYVRDRKDRVTLGAFTEDLATYYQERWSEERITIDVEVITDFTLQVNQGRLQQIFDNLILNSHYWVARSVREQQISSGRISISVNAPTVTITDNGPGIDPNLEHMLFDPFVTAKPGRQGRGLGLYIVRQLLAADNATVSLASVRNEHDRLGTFVIDFSRTESKD